MDFYSSASACTNLHPCLHMDQHHPTEEPQNGHKQQQNLHVVLIQEKILGHVGVSLFKGFPKMSKCWQIFFLFFCTCKSVHKHAFFSTRGGSVEAQVNILRLGQH